MVFLKNYRLFTAFVFALLISINASFAQVVASDPSKLGFSEERLERIDKVFKGYVDDNKMAGSVILIARKGEIAYFKAFGMSDIASISPMGKDAIFRIASQTKAIISTGIMILQEEGKLLIQDPLSKYIPEFKSIQTDITSR